MTDQQFKQLNDNSAMSTYGRFDLVLEKGSGSTAFDVNGKKYIDFGSGIGVNSLGYSNEGWNNAVFTQAKMLSHTSNLYYNTATASFTDKLIKATKMSCVFMANSGAEANECAIKLCRKYSFDKYGKGRDEIISLRNSFHGRTMQTLTATGQDVLHPDCFAPYISSFTYVNADIDSLKGAINDKTCAIMMELVQGEGGVLPLDKAFVSEVNKLAKEKDLLIVVDEVQTGIGRTGTLLCSEQFDIEPSIITLAKGLGGGLPIGACLADEKCAGTLTAGTHGSTFGGNPIVCAGASFVIDTVANDEFLSDVQKKGDYIRNYLKNCKNIASIRGLGMMIGIEVNGKTGLEVAKRCIEKGLIVLTAKSLVRLLPPLNITKDELDCGLEILKNVIEE